MFTHLKTCICLCGLLVIAILSWCQSVEAQTGEEGRVPGGRPAPAAEGGKNFILRTYEVGDLVINIEDRPFSDSLRQTAFGGGGGMGGGGFGGGGGGFFSVPGEADGAGQNPGRASDRTLVQTVPAVATRKFQFVQRLGGGGGGGFGGGGGGGIGPEGGGIVSDNARPTASVTIPDLVRVITSTVAADTWAVSGGAGQIEPLGTALVIWQEAEVHNRISELLDQLRKGSADRGTVTIDARWLMLTSDELDSLILPEHKGVPQVDRKQLERLTRRPGSLRGVTSCLSSQLVYIVGGTMKNIVSGYIPVVGSIGSPDRDVQLAEEAAGARIHFVAQAVRDIGNPRDVGYQTITQTVNFGALLEIRPTLTPLSGEAPVVVDLKSTVTVDGEKRGEADSNAATDKLAPAVDRVAIETLEFATTLRMPLKKPVLVGGLTYIPSAASAAKPDGGEQAGRKGVAAERPQLYLVLEVK